MSLDEPDDADVDRARRRAGLGFAALAVAAIVVVALVLTVGRRSENNDKKSDLAVATTSAATSKPVAPKPTASRSVVKSSAKPTPSATPSAQTTCAKTPCVLSGDAAKVAAAVSSYRTSQGQPAVTGAPTPTAAACALHSGDAAFCPGSYYWVHVAGPQGAAVVAKIASIGGKPWLLNPKLTKVGYGCAESSAGQYQCAVMDVS